MRYLIILIVSIFIMFPAICFSATLKVPSQYLTIQDSHAPWLLGSTRVTLAIVSGGGNRPEKKRQTFIHAVIDI